MYAICMHVGIHDEEYHILCLLVSIWGIMTTCKITQYISTYSIVLCPCNLQGCNIYGIIVLQPIHA